MENEQLVALTADIVSAHVSRSQVPVDDIGSLVRRVHEALAALGKEVPAQEEKVAAVSIRASIKPDRLICMECGSSQKMLKRHLAVAHQMTPQEYRRDYGLPSTYPMVAAEYADRRRELAKSIGLGRKKGEKVGPRTSRRGRKPKASAANPNEGAS